MNNAAINIHYNFLFEHRSWCLFSMYLAVQLLGSFGNSRFNFFEKLPESFIPNSEFLLHPPQCLVIWLFDSGHCDRYLILAFNLHFTDDYRCQAF